MSFTIRSVRDLLPRVRLLPAYWNRLYRQNKDGTFTDVRPAWQTPVKLLIAWDMRCCNRERRGKPLRNFGIPTYCAPICRKRYTPSAERR
jgi:hypothetical protein